MHHEYPLRASQSHLMVLAQDTPKLIGAPSGFEAVGLGPDTS